MKTWNYVLPELATDQDYENQGCDDNGVYQVMENGIVIAEFESLEETEIFIEQTQV